MSDTTWKIDPWENPGIDQQPWHSRLEAIYLWSEAFWIDHSGVFDMVRHYTSSFTGFDGILCSLWVSDVPSCTKNISQGVPCQREKLLQLKNIVCPKRAPCQQDKERKCFWLIKVFTCLWKDVYAAIKRSQKCYACLWIPFYSRNCVLVWGAYWQSLMSGALMHALSNRWAIIQRSWQALNQRSFLSTKPSSFCPLHRLHIYVNISMMHVYP